MPLCSHDAKVRHKRVRNQLHPAIGRACHSLVEKTFGWFQETGPLRRVKLRGLAKVGWILVFSYAAHDLLRLPRPFAN